MTQSRSATEPPPPTQSLEAELLVDCKNSLGECVVYHPSDGRVYWTDVYDKVLYSCEPDGAGLIERAMEEKVGSFAFDPDGNLLLAQESGLFRYRLADGKSDRLTSFEADVPATRMNDGRCDRDGRFVVGGCHQGFYNPVSSVISYDGEKATTLIERVALTNAIAFSRDGARMYFSDSETRVIHRYAYDRRTGQLGQREVFARIADDEGFADGSCVDSEDCVYNARYYAGFVQRYRPDGSLDLCVSVPTDCVTCACLGGDDFRTLFVTTGRKDLTEEQRRAQPSAGGLFAVRVPAAGLPESRFGHSLF